MKYYYGDWFPLSVIAFFVLSGMAWLTHVVWIVGKLSSDKGATVGQMALGAIGAFMPPVGVVHGVAIWFGMA